ncbi:MAG: tagaturonate epimerase family protein [Spirochaetales bacterium]|nr:tagaturonate epimerase family protein [Spirochaetales bacterium]
MELGKYSMGIGDRFKEEGTAQLKAIKQAEAEGIIITPVWNQSAREHDTIGSLPVHTRMEADEAVSLLGWNHDYFVDADHVNRETLKRFTTHCDFFTLDVASFIGIAPANEDELADAILDCRSFVGELQLEGLSEPVILTGDGIDRTVRGYFSATKEAAALYRTVEEKKGAGNFITEVSLDESDTPQSRADLFIILALLAREGVPVQTIAPRFSGEFNKGVDYVGDPEQFAREFEADLAVVSYAVKTLDLPQSLKLSVHSGSDKFSLYGPINAALKKFDAGLHLKTAGTTWLEEVIAITEKSSNGWDFFRKLYGEALERFDELCGPYKEVLDINRENLPSLKALNSWFGDDFAEALRHDPSHPKYNRDLRQLMHVSYKLAAEKGKDFFPLLKQVRWFREQNVMENLYERHIKPIFY